MMPMMMKVVLCVAFSLGTLLDLFVGILGMTIILQANSFLTYLISAITAFMLSCLRISMVTIFSSTGGTYKWLRVAFWAGILISILAAANALTAFILMRRPIWSTYPVSLHDIFISPWSQLKFIVLPILLYLVASPIIMSNLIRELVQLRTEMELEEHVRPQPGVPPAVPKG